jgi:hypothetical protein
MKYLSDKPLVCMQTQSTCYKGTTTMTPKGVLWHSTGANNSTLKRYVQPKDGSTSKEHSENTYTNAKWLEVLGKNKYANDWNHITRQAGLNAWIGKLADGTVTSIQTMPWNYKPWGCGKGSKGTCNDGWVQFEICEDGLTDKTYFDTVYKEACELTAYICKLYNINPKGTVTLNGVTVPTILCHQDAYKLKLGSNHGDVYYWFKKHGKTMDSVRNDVTTLLGSTQPTTPIQPTKVETYKLVVDVNKYSTSDDAKAKTNSKGTMKAGTYYIFDKYPKGYNGMYNLTNDSTGVEDGSWINPTENVAQVVETKPIQPPQPETPIITEPKKVYELDFPVKYKIIDKSKSIRDVEDCVKAIKCILLNNPSFDIEIVKTFFAICPIYSIDPVRAISQSILETGWFKYQGSAVTPDQHNYCGMGVTSNGVKGSSFDTIESGVKAQLQHLFAYGSKELLPSGETLVDPRFKYVTRGVAPTWEELAGRWCVPGYEGSDPEASMKAGTTYGQKIDKIYQGIISTNVSEDDIKKYFPDKEVDVNNKTEDDKVTVEKPVIDEDTKEKVNFIFEFIKKLIEFFTQFLNK